MKLSEFLLHKTQALELCVIREDGWIVAEYYIDHEDLFCRHASPKLGDLEVKGDEWDTITIRDKDGYAVEIPCHFIDV